jgi:hypothetical protein
MRITMFKNVKAIEEPYYTTPEMVHVRIKSGKIASKIIALRACTDEKELK